MNASFAEGRKDFDPQREHRNTKRSVIESLSRSNFLDEPNPLPQVLSPEEYPIVQDCYYRYNWGSTAERTNANCLADV